MAATEKDYGGVVHGISQTRSPRIRSTRPRPPLEQAAEEEQEPGRPMPDRPVKATPEKFGEFTKVKRP